MSRYSFGDVQERKEGATYFVTDFGEVKAGPKVLMYYQERLEELKNNGKRTKRGKEAAKDIKRLEEAICTLAEVYWQCEDQLEATP